jgi:hypothetical protein
MSKSSIFTENFTSKRNDYNKQYGQAKISVEWIDGTENGNIAYSDTLKGKDFIEFCF